MRKRWRYRLVGQLLKRVCSSLFTEYSNHWSLRQRCQFLSEKQMHAACRTADGTVKSLHNATEWHRLKAQHDQRGGKWPTKSWTQKTDLRRSGQQEHYKGASINGSTGLGLEKCRLQDIHGLKMKLTVKMLTRLWCRNSPGQYDHGGLGIVDWS